MMEENSNQEVKLEDVFPYEYVSGGYFRRKGIKRGKIANIIHGMEAINILFENMNKVKREGN